MHTASCWIHTQEHKPPKFDDSIGNGNRGCVRLSIDIGCVESARISWGAVWPTRHVGGCVYLLTKTGWVSFQWHAIQWWSFTNLYNTLSVIVVCGAWLHCRNSQSVRDTSESADCPLSTHIGIARIYHTGFWCTTQLYCHFNWRTNCRRPTCRIHSSGRVKWYDSFPLVAINMSTRWEQRCLKQAKKWYRSSMTWNNFNFHINLLKHYMYLLLVLIPSVGILLYFYHLICS